MTIDNKDKIKSLVDNAITEISGREIVSTAEMTDLLLDIRLHLMIEESSLVNES